MPDDDQGRPVSDEVLAAITDAMVALHVRYHGRAPATARTSMLDPDMLACLLGDVYTDVEHLTGRRVAQFMSTHHVGPDLELELFLLEP
jgi:hypothetical protein